MRPSSCSNLKPLVVLLGPTAAGKTSLALNLAGRYPLEIISADSRQIYRYMNIGTAKPLHKKGYHLIDLVSPRTNFTVADYKQKAEDLIKKIYDRKKIPLLVGGSGLYIRAVIDGLCPAPKANKRLRERLEQEIKNDRAMVYARLIKIDPQLAKKIHSHDTRRIIRALEVFILGGRPFSFYHAQTKRPGYTLLMIGINWGRQILYARIDRRVQEMINAGLVKEVRNLISRGYDENLNSLNTLGYKEIIGYLKGEYSLNEAIRTCQRNTRHFARRQLIWFRKDGRIKWIEGNDEGNLLKKAGNLLDNFMKEIKID